MTTEHTQQGQDPLDIEVDILDYAGRGEEVPHASRYKVSIDGEKFVVGTSQPTGRELLHLVGKRPCAFELIEENAHHENDVIEPDEKVDLRKHGLKGFITAHKEIVTIFIEEAPYQIERGNRTVAEILAKVGKTPDGYILLEEKGEALVPVPEDHPIKIFGCEQFFVQVKSGGSSKP